MHKIGNSIDIHPLIKGAPLMIGGVLVPSEKGSLSHSDGDALSHSIAEAIIGALGKKDLGDNFSDQDDRYKGLSSLYFLRECRKMLDKEGYRLINIDSMIVLEEPKLGVYKDLARASISKALGIEEKYVNIKAGTNEKIGSIGSKEAYLTWTVVLIEKIGE